MEFNPNNAIVRLCMQGMQMEDSNRPGEAKELFVQAWNAATNDFEKFLAAYYVARHQDNAAGKLKWYETALQFGMKVDNDGVKGAYPALYTHIAQCYEEAGDTDNAEKNRALAASFSNSPADKGPFYHGTRADLQTGDMLTAGRMSNYKEEFLMNHIYFTAIVNGAGLAAALAKGDGRERVYIVEPTGSFENDPNVTDKKFPGNPTRSYRTTEPLRVVGEVEDWSRLAPEEIQKWRERLAENDGDIIN
ncbi:MAG TPA: NAD(+)--rifampin ADP-ribosyltransferase [Flavipsychrobacter sp.]